MLPFVYHGFAHFTVHLRIFEAKLQKDPFICYSNLKIPPCTLIREVRLFGRLEYPLNIYDTYAIPWMLYFGVKSIYLLFIVRNY